MFPSSCRPCSGGKAVESGELSRAQFDAVGGAGDRRDVVALREQPRQRDLGRGGAHLGGGGLDVRDDAQVAVEVLYFPSRARRSAPLRLFIEAARELAVRRLA